MVADPQEYTISIKQGGTDSVTVGGTTVALSSVGWITPNPFDATWKYSETTIPEGEGVQPTGDNKLGGSNANLTTFLYGADPDELQASISAFVANLNAAKGNRPYLSIGLWNGAALVTSRRYIDILNSMFPMARGTRLTATEMCNVALRVVDPGLYGNTVNLETATVVSGADTHVFSPAPGGNMTTNRATYKIIKDGADNPTDVTVTMIDGAFTITGSLASVNDFWLVDAKEHTVVKSVSSVVSDDIGNFAGQFPGINAPGGEVAQIAETTTADFKVEIRYLDREQ